MQKEFANFFINHISAILAFKKKKILICYKHLQFLQTVNKKRPWHVTARAAIFDS